MAQVYSDFSLFPENKNWISGSIVDEAVDGRGMTMDLGHIVED